MKHTLLCVDDELDNVETLERLFRSSYRVLKATSAEQALEVLRAEPVSVILSDHRMPKTTGVEFLIQALAIQPEAIRILLTGYSDLNAVIAAINQGQIYRYLSKPWNNEELKGVVAQAVEKFEMKNELREKNRQLEKTLAELKVLDQAKNHFMILVNHELKTPLTGILSFLDLLQETPLTEEQKLFANRIQGNAQRLQKMISEVLELISAEIAQTPLKLDGLSSQSAIGEVLRNFNDSARLRNLAFEVTGEDALVKADRDALNGVLKRLIDNAVKFADADSKITIKAVPTPAGKIRFAVENRGPRLDEKTIAAIKKPFVLNENILNHSKGLGLGLSLSEALLRRHDSRLEISSSGQGVRVEFDLDRHSDGNPDKKPSASLF